MTILLDTNALLWALLFPHLLSPPAAAVIANHANTILVSAASAWEIATKVRIGKLPDAEFLEADFLRHIADAGYVLLSVSAADGLRAGRLRGAHRDPFDRMIAAQALGLDIAVVSSDQKLDEFGVRRIW